MRGSSSSSSVEGSLMSMSSIVAISTSPLPLADGKEEMGGAAGLVRGESSSSVEGSPSSSSSSIELGVIVEVGVGETGMGCETDVRGRERESDGEDSNGGLQARCA